MGQGSGKQSWEPHEPLTESRGWPGRAAGLGRPWPRGAHFQPRVSLALRSSRAVWLLRHRPSLGATLRHLRAPLDFPPPKMPATAWTPPEPFRHRGWPYTALRGVLRSSSGLDYGFLTCKTHALNLLMIYELASEKSLTRCRNYITLIRYLMNCLCWKK